MGKLNVNVGDEVYLKCRVKSIEERPRTDYEEEDYRINLVYPDWYNEFDEKKAYVVWSQHLLYTPDGKEA